MNLFSIFNKNWNSVFCFFGSLNEIDAIFASVNFDFRKIKIDKYWQWFNYTCLLYTSDAADDLLCVDLGGSRIIKKKKYIKQTSE